MDPSLRWWIWGCFQDTALGPRPLTLGKMHEEVMTRGAGASATLPSTCPGSTCTLGAARAGPAQARRGQARARRSTHTHTRVRARGTVSAGGARRRVGGARRRGGRGTQMGGRADGCRGHQAQEVSKHHWKRGAVFVSLHAQQEHRMCQSSSREDNCVWQPPRVCGALGGGQRPSAEGQPAGARHSARHSQPWTLLCLLPLPLLPLPLLPSTKDRERTLKRLEGKEHCPQRSGNPTDPTPPSRPPRCRGCLRCTEGPPACQEECRKRTRQDATVYRGWEGGPRLGRIFYALLCAGNTSQIFFMLKIPARQKALKTCLKGCQTSNLLQHLTCLPAPGMCPSAAGALGSRARAPPRDRPG